MDALMLEAEALGLYELPPLAIPEPVVVPRRGKKAARLKRERADK